MVELPAFLEHIPEVKCKCYLPSHTFSEFQEIFGDDMYFGMDRTNGRYADITIHTCNHCGAKWVKYFAEYEAFSRSGRWYKGIITEKEMEYLKPEDVVSYLEKLDWYIYGGSYFASTGKYGKGKVLADWW